MKEFFKELIVSSQHLFSERKIIRRKIEINPVESRITTFIGARRVGKTFYLFQQIQDLVSKKKVNTEQILYINFEDERLFPFDVSQFEVLLSAFYELYPENKDKVCYFFFDEIQEVRYWEKFIRRIHDTERVQLFLTGSSSTLLSKELATSLRGRTLSFEIFPYNFEEFVIAKKGQTGTIYDQRNQAKLKNLFQQYLDTGGFPETVMVDENQKRLLWQDYVDLIIYRDLIDRHSITNIYLIKFFIKFLIVNQGNLLSINKVYNDFKSQGMTLSKATLFDYLSYAEDAFVLFTVKIWSENLRVQQRNPFKVYSVDNGLKRVMSYKKDSGRALENLVYLHLRRCVKEIYYWKGSQEVDFCIPFESQFILINVCESLYDFKTKEREINALREAMRYFNQPKTFIISMNEEYSISVEEGSIDVIPALKWTLTDSWSHLTSRL